MLRLLCWDAREPTSIFYSWAAARDNARRAREVIPLEVWECINTTWQKLPTGHFSTVRAYSFLDWARDPVSLNMSVDDDGDTQFGDLLEDTSAVSPEQFSRMIAEQWEIWGKVVRDNNITAN